MSIGKKVWVFPDGDLPQPGDKEPFGHESLIIVNTNREKATVRMTVYFEGKEPFRDVPVIVEGERVRCVRMDKEIGDDKKFKVPYGQYALKLESDVPMVAQLGRLDVTQPNLAYYTILGYNQ